MTLQNNKDDSCTKPTLQSAKIVRPRKFQLNVNVKHAYYYNTSVTSGAINASEHKIQLHCVLLWWCAEDPRAWLLSQFHYLWSGFFCKLSKPVFIINSLYNIDVITYISVSVISYHDECDMAPHEFCIDQQSLQSSWTADKIIAFNRDIIRNVIDLQHNPSWSPG